MEQIKENNITIVGAGYVGMSLAVMLAQHNKVTVLDIDQERVKKINNKKSTINDEDIENFFTNKNLNIHATLDDEIAYKESNYIIIATPTNYNPESNLFDTSSVDHVVEKGLLINSEALIVIKSTIPIGHTNFLQEKHNTKRILFSPEFLREGKALFDNLNPSRIIIGSDNKDAKNFANILKKGAVKKEIETLFMPSIEAEAVKLFSNTYLAMRVSFFNELDTFAMVNDLDTRSIIEGVCLDNRIGNGYNNPSFGYGGYCLPKDTKQLLANYDLIPQNLIQAIVSSNATRKNFLVEEIIKIRPSTVGFYRLIMKEGSDNFRSSAILDILKYLKDSKIEIIIYEPTLKEKNYLECSIENNIEKFKIKSDLILANRLNEELYDVVNKCFSRDLFQDN